MEGNCDQCGVIPPALLIKGKLSGPRLLRIVICKREEPDDPHCNHAAGNHPGNLMVTFSSGLISLVICEKNRITVTVGAVDSE